jgi:hypothetical protein
MGLRGGVHRPGLSGLAITLVPGLEGFAWMGWHADGLLEKLDLISFPMGVDPRKHFLM